MSSFFYLSYFGGWNKIHIYLWTISFLLLRSVLLLDFPYDLCDDISLSVNHHLHSNSVGYQRCPLGAQLLFLCSERPAESSSICNCSHRVWTQPTNRPVCQADASLCGYGSTWRPVFLPRRKCQQGHKVEVSPSSQEHIQEPWRCGGVSVEKHFHMKHPDLSVLFSFPSVIWKVTSQPMRVPVWIHFFIPSEFHTWI